MTTPVDPTIPEPSRTRPDIRTLVSYRLRKAAHYATRPAYLAYGREFGVTGVEWRLMGNLHADGPMSLMRLGEEADVQPAQASRTVASLIARGLVVRETDARDARSVRLSLSTEGRALYRQLFARAVDLHHGLVAVLSDEERTTLYRALDKLAEAGRAMLAAGSD